jgi:hypothetical protein
MGNGKAVFTKQKSISDEEFFDKVSKIEEQLRDPSQVPEREEICSQFSIHPEYFNELYISYKMAFDSVSHTGDDEWNELALSVGAITKEEATLANTDEHRWILNRIKMRTVMDKDEKLRKESEIIKRDAITLFGITFPEKIGPFFIGDTTNFESTNPGLGYSIAYKSHFGAATIYIYDNGVSDIPNGPNGSEIMEQFENETLVVLNQPVAGDGSIKLKERFGTGSPARGAGFLCAVFQVTDDTGSRLSYLYLTGYSGKLVKVRCSNYSQDPNGFTPRDFADEFAQQLGANSNIEYSMRV